MNGILEMYWQHNCSCNVVVWVIVSNFVVFLVCIPKVGTDTCVGARQLKSVN